MEQLKKEFYNILGNYFSKDKTIGDYSNNAKSLANIALVNQCITFFFESAKFAKIDPNEKVKSLAMQIIANNYKKLNVQKKVIELLSKNNISCVVLKGTSLSINYAEPMLRPLGDIDLLVSVADYNKAIDILSGTQTRSKLSLMHTFHYHLIFEGVSVEIHKAITHFKENELSIADYMNDALENIKYERVDFFDFPVLADEFQAITLLLHIKRHYFENKLNVRMLCDWAMFIDKIDQTIWNDKIYPILINFNLNKWADVLSTTCKKYLKIYCDNKIHSTYQNHIFERLADEFISDSFKNNSSNISSINKKSFYNLITLLNDIAIRDYIIAKKFKVLLPFFWIVIAIRYYYRRKIGLRKKFDIWNYSLKYSTKDNLFKEIMENHN